MGQKQADWPVLRARIDELLDGQAALVAVECSTAVEREARRIAAQLLARRKIQAPTKESEDDQPTEHFQSIDTESIELVNSRSVGVRHCLIEIRGTTGWGIWTLVEDFGESGIKAYESA